MPPSKTRLPALHTLLFYAGLHHHTPSGLGVRPARRSNRDELRFNQPDFPEDDEFRVDARRDSTTFANGKVAVESVKPPLQGHDSEQHKDHLWYRACRLRTRICHVASDTLKTSSQCHGGVWIEYDSVTRIGRTLRPKALYRLCYVGAIGSPPQHCILIYCSLISVTIMIGPSFKTPCL